MQIGTFALIKSQLDIEVVAAHYGLYPDCHGKYRCIWHDDHNNSLSVDKANNKLKCFSCYVFASSIDLVMKLFGVSNVEATERINSDFHLGLHLDEPPKAADLQRIRREKILADNFAAWEIRSFIEVNEWFKILSDSMERNKPKDPDKPLPLEWCYAAERIERAKYLLNILTREDHAAHLDLFKTCRKEIKQIEKFVS
jgi:hypothetical protein